MTAADGLPRWVPVTWLCCPPSAAVDFLRQEYRGGPADAVRYPSKLDQRDAPASAGSRTAVSAGEPYRESITVGRTGVCGSRTAVSVGDAHRGTAAVGEGGT